MQYGNYAVIKRNYRSQQRNYDKKGYNKEGIAGSNNRTTQ